MPQQNIKQIKGATQGSVLFLGSNGVVSENNSGLYWDNVNNRLGVGAVTSTYRLTVSGTISTSGFVMSTGAASGYVLTSDANGVATWATASGGSTATNGLTYSGSIIKLGGVLTEHTLITNGNRSFTMSTSNNIEFYKNLGGITYSNLLNNTGASIKAITNIGFNLLNVDDASARIEVKDIVSGSSFSNIKIFNFDQIGGVNFATDGSDASTNNRMVVRDDYYSKGLVYAGDYSANFTNNSLVTKAYVDSAAVNQEKGLIQIVDKNGDFFTDLATAMAYIRTYIDENAFPINDESFNQGVYYFTVPQNTECILASYFLGDDSNTISAYIIDKLGLITKYTTKCFQKNSGNNYLGNCEFDITSGASSDAPFYYATGQNSIGSFILNSTVWFGRFSTGSFIFRGDIGPSENTSYLISPGTSFFVQQSKYTSNAGGIHASLVNNPKVFFGGIDKVEKNIIVSSSVTAALDTNYTMNATSTFTDPTPVEAKGYTVFVINGTATVGGVAYSVGGTIIKRFYHSGAWITYVYSNGGLMIDYSSAATYNGWSSFITQKVFGIDYALYTIWTVEVSGTSDSAFATVTIPTVHNAMYPNITMPAFVTNNGVNSSAGRVQLLAGTNIIQWALTASSGGFSAFGTKTVRFQGIQYK